MLYLNLPNTEFFDESSNEFVVIDGGTFSFEHSLRAISAWEAKHKTPFLHHEHTPENLKDYFVFMALDKPPSKLLLNKEICDILVSYMNDSQTATVINDPGKKSSRKVITSEYLYAMMAMSQVPFDCDTWHINRLLMVLQIIGIESNPNKKKMSKREIMSQNKALNAARKQKLNTKG